MHLQGGLNSSFQMCWSYDPQQLVVYQPNFADKEAFWCTTISRSSYLRYLLFIFLNEVGSRNMSSWAAFQTIQTCFGVLFSRFYSHFIFIFVLHWSAMCNPRKNLQIHLHSIVSCVYSLLIYPFVLSVNWRLLENNSYRQWAVQVWSWWRRFGVIQIGILH